MLDFARTDATLAEPSRVGAVKALLASEPPVAEIERVLSALAAKVGAPLAAATALDAGTQHLIATNVGPIPSSPADTSHCQYVIASGRFLCISDMTTDSTWKRLARRLSTGQTFEAYLGFPLRYQGQIIGSVCVVDLKRHEWSTEDQYEVYAASRQVSDILAR